MYRIDNIELDPVKGCLRREGEEIHLRPKTFEILLYLVTNRERLIGKEELIEQFWSGTAVCDDVLSQSIAELRQVLGDNSREPRYLKTIRKRGYRFIGEVEELSEQGVVATEQVTTIQVREEYSDEGPRRKFPRWVFAAAVVVAIVATVSALSAWHYCPKATLDKAEAGIRTAIIRFENRSGKPEMEWMRDGLADMLATSLSASPRIAVITAQQLERGLRNSTNSPIRLEDALQGARKSGAGAVILGAFASLGDTIRVDTQIYDVSSGHLLGGESLTVEKPELLLAQLDSLSSKLATRLGAPIAAQTRLAEVMTNNLEAYRLYSLGLTRARELRLPEAIALYQKALELDSGVAMAYARIGLTYSSTWAKPEEGKPYLEKAYHLSDRLTARDRMFIRAWYAVACRDYHGAERAYQEIVTAFPLEGEAYVALGTLLSGDGRNEESLQILQRGVKVQADSPQLHNALTTVYMRLGETQKAVESAQRYVTLSGEPNAYDTLAAVYQETGRYAEARETYLEAIRRKPDFEIAIIHLGNLYFELGRYREALQQYSEYTRLAPSNSERSRGHGSSSWVYWKKGDLGNAEREAEELIRLNPRNIHTKLLIKADRGGLILTDDLRRQILGPTILSGRGTRENYRIPYFVAGYVALRDHKTEEALQHFRASLAEPPIYWNIDPLETCLGDAYLELDRLDEAIAEYRRVLKFNSNYPMARYRLGLALEKKGMSAEARAEFERFLAIWKEADPDVPELADARRRVGQSVARLAR